ncbi:MAG: type II secretion system protein [Candidatus Shapirobacteria bacterium]|nr:type II secretion system protein [Candidatus Shapirobacteria bacterium]
MISKLIKTIKTKKGFTLVELLVVISIIGVLTTLLMVNFMGSRERANDAQKIQNLASLKNALRMYYNDNQSYPISVSPCTNCLSSAIGSSYLPNITSIGYTYTSLDSGNGFIITAGLESGAGVDWANSQLNCGIGTTVVNVYAICGN